MMWSCPACGRYVDSSHTCYGPTLPASAHKAEEGALCDAICGDLPGPTYRCVRPRGHDGGHEPYVEAKEPEPVPCPVHAPIPWATSCTCPAPEPADKAGTSREQQAMEIIEACDAMPHPQWPNGIKRACLYCVVEALHAAEAAAFDRGYKQGGADCATLTKPTLDEWDAEIAKAQAAARAEEREESSRVLKVVDDSARRILLDIRVEGPEHDPCWGACKVLADDAPHEPPCERARRFCARGGSQ